MSPDGRHVAFSGAYERPGEAYLMPLAGGVPQRLTRRGQNPRVWGFTPAGQVLVTAPSLRGEPVTQLFAIDPRQRTQRVLPVGQASDGALSADGQALYFTRHGLHSDNVRAYRGGAMAQLWGIDLRGATEAEPLLRTQPGNHQRPMPYSSTQGPRVAFLSDRDGSYNLWSVDARGGDLRQHTRHRGWDIRHAAIGGRRPAGGAGFTASSRCACTGWPKTRGRAWPAWEYVRLWRTPGACCWKSTCCASPTRWAAKAALDDWRTWSCCTSGMRRSRTRRWMRCAKASRAYRLRPQAPRSVARRWC